MDGNGDAFLESKKVKEVSLSLLDWIIEKEYCAGLDGIDLSTVYPESSDLSWVSNFNELNRSLKKYQLNPNNSITNLADTNFSNLKEYKRRSPFRLFYSVHSGVHETRSKLIPRAKPITEALDILLTNALDYNLIFHHIFLHGINDTAPELESLLILSQKYLKEKELRILRYNECNWSFFYESEQFVQIIDQLQKHVDILKVQIYPGSEIQAACGQFLVKDYIRKK